MWIRRIHLYSGLVMFPWVLLYGFTALLFNRPNTFTDSRTEIRHLQLDPYLVQQWFETEQLSAQVLRSMRFADAGGSAPSDSSAIAEKVASTAVKNEQATENSPAELHLPSDRTTLSAIFSGTVSYSHETPTSTETLTIDPNTGAAIHRITTRPLPQDKKPKPKKVQLPQAFPWVENQLAVLIAAEVEEPEKWILQRQPSLEFWSTDGSNSPYYRFTPTTRDTRQRGTPTTPNDTHSTAATTPSGDVMIIGEHPRELNWRNYLLRLHTAHGYPFERNARWFWAITVDAMFACMVFWGFSGLVMWWQIKRTRLFGSIAIVLSLVLAIALAIAMHWEMVHG